MKANKLKAPNTYLIIFSLIIVTAILTYLLPGGKYQMVERQGRRVIDPASFTAAESNPQGVDAVLMAPLNGFVDAALIIGFVLIVGGAFSVLQKTRAVDAGIQTLARAHEKNALIRKLTIPLFMVLFSLGGAVFGMSEEVIPFIMIFIPMALALGYDSVTGVAIPFVGAGAGFAAAFINPFTLGVAQGIANLPPLSGIGYRIFCWTLTTLVAIVFVQRYANKIKKEPHKSISAVIDAVRRKEWHVNKNAALHLTGRHKWVLGLFLAAMVLLVYGVLAYQWYIKEIAALFLGMGMVAGIAGGLKAKDITDGFIQGAKELIGTALVIALARGILIIARDGQIIGTILHGLSSLIKDAHPVLAAQIMFLVQTVINFFVPSGSGQAALTMPIMAPLSDLLNVSRQTAVLAFQFGDGFSNLIIPTSAVTMGVLALAEIPWEKWARWILPLEIAFFILSFILLVPPFFMHWK